MRRRRLGVTVALLVPLLSAPAGVEAQPAELSDALRARGAPSLLWGRLAVEEESPEGAWTPLGGVAVTLYPYTAGLAADLERIRDGARASGRDYDAAVARLQERLQAHAADVAVLTGMPLPPGTAPEPRSDPVARPGVSPGRPPSPGGAPARPSSERAAPEPEPPRPPGAEGETAGSAADGPIRRTTTDVAGLFVFPAVPAGQWLVVAIHTSPYSATRRPSPSARASRAAPGHRDGLLERERPQAKEAEVWVSRVRVTADQPARLLLSERSRFMVGPLR